MEHLNKILAFSLAGMFILTLQKKQQVIFTDLKHISRDRCNAYHSFIFPLENKAVLPAYRQKLTNH